MRTGTIAILTLGFSALVVELLYRRYRAKSLPTVRHFSLGEARDPTQTLR